MKKYNIAIVGPLGVVGRKIRNILEERDFPINKIKLLGSERNKNKKVLFRGQEIYTKVAEEGAFTGVDIVFFCAGNQVSKELGPIAVEEGALVIDNSSAWRMDPQVPLIIPEVNPEDLSWHKGIIANPNCSSTQMLVALKPIDDKYNIKRVVVSTYQAVSGTGKDAIDELNQQVLEYINDKEISYSIYPHQILFNVLPHIDDFLDTGYTKEEMKMIDESKKILDEDINITATTVIHTIVSGHTESINIETKFPINIKELIELFNYSKGIKILDNPKDNLYPMPINSTDRDEVFIGRIRKDNSIDNGVNL